MSAANSSAAAGEEIDTLMMTTTRSPLPSAVIPTSAAALRAMADIVSDDDDKPKVETPVSSSSAKSSTDKKEEKPKKKKAAPKKKVDKEEKSSSSSSSDTAAATAEPGAEKEENGSKATTKGKKRKEMTESEKQKIKLEKSSKDFEELKSIRTKLYDAAKDSGAIITRLSKLPNSNSLNEGAALRVQLVKGEEQGVRWYTTSDVGNRRWAFKLTDVLDSKRYENLGGDFKTFYTIGSLKKWLKMLVEDQFITDYQYAAVFFVGVETDNTTSLFGDLTILRSFLKSNYWTGSHDTNYFYDRDYKEEVGLTMTEAHEAVRPLMKAVTDAAECERANKRVKKEQTKQISKQELARCNKKDICPVCGKDTKDEKGDPIGEHDACLYEVVEETPSKPVKTTASSSSSSSPVASDN